MNSENFQLESDKLFLPAQEVNRLEVLRQEVDDRMSDVRIHLTEFSQAYTESLNDHKGKFTSLLKAYKRLESEIRKKDLKIALLEDRLQQGQRKEQLSGELSKLNAKMLNLEQKQDSNTQNYEKGNCIDELILCGVELPIDCPQSTQMDDGFQSLESGNFDSDDLNRTVVEPHKDSSSKFGKFMRAIKTLRNKRNKSTVKQPKRLLNSGFLTDI